MKKIFFIFLSLLTFSANAQTDVVVINVNKDILQKRLDSAMQARYYITSSDAEKILGNPSHLKDSTYKYAGGLLRYSFNYVIDHPDSLSKGKIFFTFEQYKDELSSKDIYQVIKTENEKGSAITVINDIGDEGFVQKDNTGQPFMIVRKKNKLYKLRVYYTKNN